MLRNVRNWLDENNRPKERGPNPPCPVCGNQFHNTIEVSNAILAKNRDARFCCSNCSFESLMKVTYCPLNMPNIPKGTGKLSRRYFTLKDDEVLRALNLFCSICNGPVKNRSAFELTPVLRRNYLYCLSPKCGQRFVALFEHIEQLSYSNYSSHLGIPYSEELLQQMRIDAPRLRRPVFTDGF